MSLLLVSSILILLVALFFPLWFFFTRNKSLPKLPQGNRGFISERLAFYNSRRKNIQEIFFFDRMKKFSSEIFKTSLFGDSTFVFCQAAGNKFLFTNEDKLVKVRFSRNIEKLFPQTPPISNSSKHIFRRMILGFLKPEALQKYVPTMDSICKQQIKNSCENKKEVTIIPLVGNYTFAIGCKIFLNLEDPIQVAKLEHLFSYIGHGLWSLPINIPGTAFHKTLKVSELIKKDLVEIIKRRNIELASNKASPGQDILSYMLTPSEDDEGGQVIMDESDVATKLLGVLIAGHDTSRSTISLVVKYLAEFPRVYNQVLAEQMAILKSKAPGELLNWEDVQKMKYSWNVACEVMRLAPPTPGNFREALTDFTYAGYLIPKGWKLYWTTNATHKNPNYFPDPEKFDPSRFEGNGPAPYTYVPFGGGPRMCPGREYARLEICVFIHNLATKFKWEKVNPYEKVVVHPIPIPANGLPIRLQPHIC